MKKTVFIMALAFIAIVQAYSQGVLIYNKGKILNFRACEVDSIVPYKSADEVNIQDHESVDLGLSVRWATCNLGADAPEKAGDYYNWGECVANPELYAINNMVGNISGTIYDTATKIWGEGWRMPTASEWQELSEKCTWSYTTINNKQGYRVTGANGNSIFLPVAGYYNTLPQDVYDLNSYGYYWSGTKGVEYYSHTASNSSTTIMSIEKLGGLYCRLWGGSSDKFSIMIERGKYMAYSIRAVKN